MSITLDAVLRHASEVVRAAGEIARQGFGKSPIVKEKALSDIVTQADTDVERYVISNLQASYPDHGFISEEAGDRAHDAEYVWILDPIDGTKYYACGIPLYSISLALQWQGKLILGVVFNPQTNEMFVGASRQMATLNDEPIHCSHSTQLDDSTLCVEIPSRDSPAATRRWGLEKMALLVDRVRRVRILGVSALGLCYCARGGFEAYVNLGSTATQYYDVAGGRAILEAAGGEFRDLGQGIVAGPPKLCQQLMELLGLQDEN